MTDPRLFRQGVDADAVHPRLWIGSKPRTGDVLRRAGFHVVVLAAREVQPHGFDGVEVVRAGIDDSFAPTIDEMRTVMRAGRLVAQKVLAGKRVLVTCAMGLNRSGLVTALALRNLEGLSGRKAMEVVQAHRKGALYNATFQRMLANLD